MSEKALALDFHALACPRCEAGIEARQQVLEQKPLENLWAALLPFVLIGVASLLVERVGKGRS
jgi:hypothetical protein